MMTAIKAGLGYDDMGNCARLLHPDDKRAIEGDDGHGGIRRAAGDTPCRVCGEIYYRHPPVQGALYMTRTCREIVKL